MRIVIANRDGSLIGDLNDKNIIDATLREEINGEHALELTTLQVLEKGQRLLHKDGSGKWREFSVSGVDSKHYSGETSIGTYYCPWSLQEDLQGVTVSVMPGVQTPVNARNALTALLSTQTRWAVGIVTNNRTGGASMYDRSAWNAISVLLDNWGGEIDARLTVDNATGVVGRYIDYYAAQGNASADYSFDFDANLTLVERIMSDDPFYCRISPRGKGEETEGGGYGRKITIESVNGGRDYLEYSPMVSTARLKNTDGTYTYPTLIIENSDCETPTELKDWATGVISEYCTPEIIYKIGAVQAANIGVDLSGAQLGDAVKVVDRKFNGTGLYIESRIWSMSRNLVDESNISVDIGAAQKSLSSKF